MINVGIEAMNIFAGSAFLDVRDSGCCSEFFSGIVTKEGQEQLVGLDIEGQLKQRYQLSMAEYDSILAGSSAVKFGTRNTPWTADSSPKHANRNVCI